MNLASLLFPRGQSTPEAQALLQRATRIMEQLPDASPGSQIAIAFGHDRDAFAAALLGTWLKGHGAAIVENSLRERILTVLDRPPVAMLLHDTGSGRVLQVPRFLAEAPQNGDDLVTRNPDLAELTASPLLTVHVQTDDGQQHWCSWHAADLAAAIDEFAEQLAKQSLPPAPARQTPGLVAAMFANTLLPLRQGKDLSTHALVDARGIAIRGVPTTKTVHQPRIEELLRCEGITDAAVVCSSDNRLLIAIAGPGAVAMAPTTPNARAFTQIPRDPNGQPQVADVFLAFGLSRTGCEVRHNLHWQITSCDENRATLRTTVPLNYLFFEGHFATYPVLAGGVQLHELMMPCLRQVCAELPAINQLDGIKFLARIAPGDEIDVLIERGEDPSRVSFEVRKLDVRCTHGRVQFATAIPPLQRCAHSNTHSPQSPTTP